MLDFVRAAIALCGTVAICYFDIFHKKQIPDALLWGFFVIALATNVLNYATFLNNLLFAALLIALLYALYRAGQIGGADVVLLAAIYAAIPELRRGFLTAPTIAISMPSIFPMLATSTLLFAVVMTANYIPKCIVGILKRKIKFSVINTIASAALIMVYIFFLFSTVQFSFHSTIYFGLLTIVVFAGAFFTMFKDFIVESMVKWKTAKEIEPEDILALEKINEEIVKKLKLGRLVTPAQCKEMRKLKKMKWPVLDLPCFTPYILISLVIYLLFGNVFLYPI